MGIFLFLLYTSIFLFLIRKMPFFALDGISKNSLSFFFLVKVFFGVALWWIYTYYYTERATADIYKYFDDSKVMYDALWVHPSDYIRMLFGFGNDNPYFDRVYYTHMNHWYHEFGNTIYNDNHTIIRFNAFVRIFSFGHYNVHSVFMCFISFIGLTAIYKTFEKQMPDKKRPLALAVFLVPSVLLWSSGVLKEGFLFFGLGLLLYHFHHCVFRQLNLKSFAWIVLALFLLMIAKFYVLACLGPGMMAWVVIRKRTNYITVIFSSLLVLLFILALNLHFVLPKYDVLKQLAWKQSDFIAQSKGGTYLVDKLSGDTLFVDASESKKIGWIKNDSLAFLPGGLKYHTWKKRILSDPLFVESGLIDTCFFLKKYEAANSRITIAPLEPRLMSLFKNTPAAFLNSLLRPYPFESRSPMILFPAIENMLILVFCLICLFFGNFKKTDLKLFYFCAIFVFLLYVLTGLTTPVTGAIVRYRVPAVPFLLITFLLLLDSEKLLKKFPLLKNFFG